MLTQPALISGQDVKQLRPGGGWTADAPLSEPPVVPLGFAPFAPLASGSPSCSMAAAFLFVHNTSDLAQLWYLTASVAMACRPAANCLHGTT